MADVREIVEKAGIRETFLFLIDELFSDFSCGNEFCPNLHTSIIQEIPEKVNKKRALEKMPFHPLPPFFNGCAAVIEKSRLFVGPCLTGSDTAAVVR